MTSRATIVRELKELLARTPEPEDRAILTSAVDYLSIQTRTPCAECGEHTHDWYMVHNELWTAAGMRGGFLHLTCLSKRLGRPLTKADFTNAHINSILTAIP